MTAQLQDFIAIRPTRRTAKLIWTGLAIAALAVVAFVVVQMSIGSSHHAQPTAPPKAGVSHAGNIPANDCVPGRVVRPC
jgi:hypothetical protein